MENLNSEVVNEQEILGDLKNDLKQNSAAPTGQVEFQKQIIPSFLPVQLVRVVVAGKNGIIVSNLAKNVSLEIKDTLKEAFKPTDNEVDIYKRLLETVIFKYLPSVYQWFMSNDVESVFAEAALFETVRVLPWLPVIKGEENLMEEKKAA